MIRLIGLDLDGSLLSDDGSVCKENLDAVKRARAAGIKVCIVSGRNEESIRRYVNLLNLEDELHVAANGAMLVDYRKGHRDLFTVDGKVYDDFVKSMRKNGRQFMPMNRHGYYYEDRGQEIYEVIRNWIDKKSLREADIDNVSGVYRISVLFDGEEDLERLKASLPSALYGNVDKNVYDIRPRGVSKLEGIRIMANELEISEDEIAFIGDQASDIEILSALENSFSPKNAEDAAKKRASVVLQRTNNEGAVAEMISDYILQPEDYC